MRKFQNSATCAGMIGMNNCVKQIDIDSFYLFSRAIESWSRLPFDKDRFSGGIIE